MERDCGAWINLLSHLVKRRLNNTLVNLGINAMQSRVLHYIRVHYRDGPVFQRDVEVAFGLSRSTVTGVLQHLEREGLICRESVQEDGRLKSLVPTHKADELDEQVRACLQQIEVEMTAGISPASTDLCGDDIQDVQQPQRLSCFRPMREVVRAGTKTVRILMQAVL